MQSIESLSNDLDAKVYALLDGPPSSNYAMRQVQLAVQKFIRENPATTLDHEHLEQANNEWAGSKISEGFRAIYLDPSFKDHPRFKGDVANIALEDIQHRIETGTMPE